VGRLFGSSLGIIARPHLSGSQAQWLTPVVLATLEVEIGRIMIERLVQAVSKTPAQSILKARLSSTHLSSHLQEP
jgi:hypothetical protein